ncbi:hypothetical protein NI389_18265 (plasmid) [Pseudoalteromonas xiamenensis]|uniref:DUF4386 family protein n=1 Tax=Pseudoalteromonas xiamenensis TaxID=882626 RepID=UPI0027E40455|nr:DUF4386 family protein [Pseudoalteromonas xiamenensis]WMN61755.1 hypothetical protein NI389_18265 [Pseudoalteromonas xiamenensis]
MKKVTLSTILGGLLLVQMAGGLFLNFRFLGIFKSDIFTVDMASLTTALGFATFMALLLSFINVVVGMIAVKRFQSQQPMLSLLVILMASLGLVLTGIEYANLANYTAFISDVQAKGLSELNESMEFIRRLIVSERNESHYLSLFLSSFSLLLFYTLLYRATRMPKLLLAFAITSCALQLIALSSTFFQGPVIVAIQLPLFITQLVMPVYFIVFGFRASTQPIEGSIKTNSLVDNQEGI